MTSSAILRWSQERRIEWHYIAPGKPMQNGFVERLAFGQLRFQWPFAGRMPQRDAVHLAGGTTTTRSDHTRKWAGRPPPRSPANVSGGMPPDTLPSHQTSIMKERDSTSEW